MVVISLMLLAMGSPLLDHAFLAWRSTRQMRIEDAYKWLYQATLGGEHAVTDDSGPRAWLDGEWGTLGPPNRREPLIEKLTPDGKLIRVNLRPLKAQGGDKGMLLAIFVESARAFRSDKLVFHVAWRELGSVLSRKSWRSINHREWTRLDAECRKANYPAVHHSRAYEQAYHPAYRVILGDLWLGKN